MLYATCFLLYSQLREKVNTVRIVTSPPLQHPSGLNTDFFGKRIFTVDGQICKMDLVEFGSNNSSPILGLKHAVSVDFTYQFFTFVMGHIRQWGIKILVRFQEYTECLSGSLLGVPLAFSSLLYSQLSELKKKKVRMVTSPLWKHPCGLFWEKHFHD